MLKRLRESKNLQGTLLASPAIVWMLVLLIIPLLLVVVTSFGGRDPDGNVIYKFSLDNYARLIGVPDSGFDPNCAQVSWLNLALIIGLPGVIAVLLRAAPRWVKPESNVAGLLPRISKLYTIVMVLGWLYIGARIYSNCADALYVGILGRSLELAF